MTSASGRIANATRGSIRIPWLQQRVGPVVYWMSRDQRIDDNHALLYAQAKADSMGTPLGGLSQLCCNANASARKHQYKLAVVVFSLSPSFLGATLRQYGFMLRGLKQGAFTCRIPC
jgi:deoxyribodipyrimidine photo-lyase